MKLLSAIGHLSLQTQAQFGLRKFGVPFGGPFDSLSSRLANAILGNSEWAPVIELAGANLVFEVRAQTWMSFVGYGHDLNLDGKAAVPHSRFLVDPGQSLTLTPNRVGLRAYLGFPGGVKQQGEGMIRALQPTGLRSATHLAAEPDSLSSGTIHIIDASIDGITIVTPHIDRVGLRIEQADKSGQSSAELSTPSALGAIQSTPDGQLLIHGPDGPTLAGYPIVAVVASVDHPRLAQLRPGDNVSFSTISVQEALKAQTEFEREFQLLLRQVRLSI